jgi:hypothetical protein
MEFASLAFYAGVPGTVYLIQNELWEKPVIGVLLIWIR